MTPIEKNIIVVDEHGNEYEATYPKRAKGLVKNGRARFIDEHTICLACPPDKSEDIHMSENTSTNQTTNIQNIEASATTTTTDAPLTAREIFEKIAALQKQLTESSFNALYRLGEPISSICEEDNEEKVSQILEVCNVFKMRENTFAMILELYQKMYNDLNVLEKNRIDTVRAAFSDQLECISKSELTNEDRYAAISEITNKISELTESLLVPATSERTKQKIVDQMTWTISSNGASEQSKTYAADVLKAFMTDN